MSHPDDQPSPAAPALAFGDFVLDRANARLTRAGVELPLSRKPFALLAELAQRPGELVSKDHLLDTVWQRRFVSDSAVKSVLSELRATLGDDARAPRWIETVQARGYRFVGAVHAASAAAAPVAKALGNLPLPAKPLIGREERLQRLAEQLQPGGPALVTLVGPAGVGKSLFALMLAHRLRDAGHEASPQARQDGCGWRDGIWLLDLAALAPGAEPALLRAALAHTLHLSDAAARDEASLARSLQGLRLLLVLDNAEHVLDSLAPTLAALLSQAGGVQVLATSRGPLHLPMEQVHALPPLELPDEADDHDAARCSARAAAQLFLARVNARIAGFAIGDAQAPLLGQLCRALDGLPLALELAATRVPTLGLDGLHRQLAPADAEQALETGPARLRLLATGAQRGAPRHQTLRAALDWSHGLLTAPQQRVLRRLSVLHGPFELADAQAVAGVEPGSDDGESALDDWAVLEALEALVDRCWVSASETEPRRFRLLHGVRAYARERLVDAGEASAAHRRHFHAVLRYWQRAEPWALAAPALQWVQEHDAALTDLRAALAWGCDAVCVALPPLPGEPAPLDGQALLGLVAASGLIWHRAGHAGEGVRWCERALALAGNDAARVARAGVDLVLAHLAGIAMVLPAPQGLAAARRAADAFGHRGDAMRAMYALYLQHTLLARAESDTDRGHCLARLRGSVQPGWGELLRRFARHAEAYEARLQGRHAEYLAFNRAELARCRALDATWEAWSAGIGLMLALHDAGELARAVAAGREVLDEIRAAGRLRQNANRLAMWIMMLAESGDITESRAALAEAWPILQGAERAGMALLGGAWLALHQGRQGLAVRLLARFDAPGRTGGEFGPGTFIRRSVGGLWGRLRAALSDPTLAAERAAAEGQSDGEVIRDLLATG